MRPFARKPRRNLLDLVPERVFESTVGDDGTVTVDMPRFHVAWMQRHLVPAGRAPFIRIRLDRFGSHAWEAIDGVRTVGALADELAGRFGDEVQPVYERLGTYIHLLKNRGFIHLKTVDGARVF